MSSSEMILIMASTLTICQMMYRQDMPTAAVLQQLLGNKTLIDLYMILEGLIYQTKYM